MNVNASAFRLPSLDGQYVAHSFAQREVWGAMGNDRDKSIATPALVP